MCYDDKDIEMLEPVEDSYNFGKVKQPEHDVLTMVFVNDEKLEWYDRKKIPEKAIFCIPLRYNSNILFWYCFPLWYEVNEKFDGSAKYKKQFETNLWVKFD